VYNRSLASPARHGARASTAAPRPNRALTAISKRSQLRTPASHPHSSARCTHAAVWHIRRARPRTLPNGCRAAVAPPPRRLRDGRVRLRGPRAAAAAARRRRGGRARDGAVRARRGGEHRRPRRGARRVGVAGRRRRHGRRDGGLRRRLPLRRGRARRGAARRGVAHQRRRHRQRAARGARGGRPPRGARVHGRRALGRPPAAGRRRGDTADGAPDGHLHRDQGRRRAGGRSRRRGGPGRRRRAPAVRVGPRRHDAAPDLCCRGQGGEVAVGGRRAHADKVRGVCGGAAARGARRSEPPQPPGPAPFTTELTHAHPTAAPILPTRPPAAAPSTSTTASRACCWRRSAGGLAACTF
jgi:hypothetical protein